MWAHGRTSIRSMTLWLQSQTNIIHIVESMTFQATIIVGSSRSQFIISVSPMSWQQATTLQAQPLRLKLMVRLLPQVSTRQSLAVLGVALVAWQEQLWSGQTQLVPSINPSATIPTSGQALQAIRLPSILTQRTRTCSIVSTSVTHSTTCKSQLQIIIQTTLAALFSKNSPSLSTINAILTSLVSQRTSASKIIH